MNFLKEIVKHRVKKVPITDVLKDSFMGVGALFGGIYGFKKSFENCNGVVWRPTLGCVTGGAIGYTIGLFPFHTFGILILGDVTYTVLEKSKIKD